ncbi:MAG: hypothetical protein GQ527_00530 [Bacteroidales bacterium]|nr:hypothetical protein [Bacteroidales bacterium]
MRKRRPSAIKRFWFRLGGRNPYMPTQAKKTSTSSLSWNDIVKNYKAYRLDKRKYLAQKKLLKIQEKARRQKERRNNQDNPFFQLLFSHEHSRKVAVDQDGNIVYSPSIWNSVIHIINSLASFIVAYLLVYLFYQLVVLITASFYDIDAVLYYYKLVFNDHSQLWDRLNIIFITLSGPVNSLIFGFIFYNYLFRKAKDYPRLQLFFLWVGLLSFAHFFAAFIAGIATNKGFGYVQLWLFWNEFTKFFFAFIALLTLVILGYTSASRFQVTSNISLRIQKQNRALFYLHQVFLPYIIGFIIIYLVKIPNNYPYDTSILAFSTIMFGAVFFNVKAKGRLVGGQQNNLGNLNWVLVLLAIVSLYSFRVYLEEGLHFVIRLYVSITPAGS